MKSNKTFIAIIAKYIQVSVHRVSCTELRIMLRLLKSAHECPWNIFISKGMEIKRHDR